MATQSSHPARHRVASAAPPDTKVERIVRHCVYEIATGAWPPDTRLPSLRAARDLWRVNHLTVLRAYRQLMAMGLLTNSLRSGFFVRHGATVADLGRARDLLHRLFETTRRSAARLPDASILGTFRYLARIAESRARQEPECAFVECTAFQATMHAREVQAHLDFPCLALTTTDLAAGRVPGHVRALLTTSFHQAEVTAAARPRRLRTAAVPIELSPELARRIAVAADQVTVLALSHETALHTARSARALLRAHGVRVVSAKASAAEVEERVAALVRGAAHRRHAVLLSTSLWSALPEPARRAARVFPFECRILASAWAGIAVALGLPPGAAV